MFILMHHVQNHNSMPVMLGKDGLLEGGGNQNKKI
jgi:hypothetical protein